MIRTDTHLHSSFSSDSDTPIEDMVRRAIDLGLTTICFTEHFDMDFPDTPSHLDFQLDFDTYFDTLDNLKSRYEDRIEILSGVEFGIQPSLGDRPDGVYAEYADRIDFVINSCHLVKRLDPYHAEYFETYPGMEGMRLYFEEILANLKIFHNWHSAGHLDYAYRYMPEPVPEFSYRDYGDILDAILEYIIKKDAALEINTAGLKYGLAWPNPHIDILKRYREIGGRLITIGSDGHIPEHMAYDFDKVPGILEEAGFREYVVYRKGVPCEISLS